VVRPSLRRVGPAGEDKPPNDHLGRHRPSEGPAPGERRGRDRLGVTSAPGRVDERPSPRSRLGRRSRPCAEIRGEAPDRRTRGRRQERLDSSQSHAFMRRHVDRSRDVRPGLACRGRRQAGLRRAVSWSIPGGACWQGETQNRPDVRSSGSSRGVRLIAGRIALDGSARGGIEPDSRPSISRQRAWTPHSIRVRIEFTIFTGLLDRLIHEG
jgi:hypothetical protein